MAGPAAAIPRPRSVRSHPRDAETSNPHRPDACRSLGRGFSYSWRCTRCASRGVLRPRGSPKTPSHRPARGLSTARSQQRNFLHTRRLHALTGTHLLEVEIHEASIPATARLIFFNAKI